MGHKTKQDRQREAHERVRIKAQNTVKEMRKNSKLSLDSHLDDLCPYDGFECNRVSKAKTAPNCKECGRSILF